MNQEIVEAIKKQNIVKIYYDGKLRVIEPHCYGETSIRNEGLRAYQVAGFSTTGKMGWKMYDLAKIEDIQVTDETFKVRSDYRKGDKGLVIIYMEI